MNNKINKANKTNEDNIKRSCSSLEEAIESLEKEILLHKLQTLERHLQQIESRCDILEVDVKMIENKLDDEIVDRKLNM